MPLPLALSFNDTVGMGGRSGQPCIKQCPGLSLGTGYQFLQSLFALIAVDQQHLLDPVLLEAHVTELLPEAQELPCLEGGTKGTVVLLLRSRVSPSLVPTDPQTIPEHCAPFTRET